MPLMVPVIFSLKEAFLCPTKSTIVDSKHQRYLLDRVYYCNRGKEFSTSDCTPRGRHK